ncbi:MAG: hypothetical protein HYZ37_02620 [Candidatus Solibacter usitatus]|nr:hypothetical protein [Candidatus Solibacter usitatus]
MSWLEQARELAAQGQVGSAIDLLERAVAMGEEDAELCKEIARMCLGINEVRAFANWCHEAIRINPADGEPYLMMARELVAKRRWVEAAETLEHALRCAVLPQSMLVEANELLARVEIEVSHLQQHRPGFSNL